MEPEKKQIETADSAITITHAFNTSIELIWKAPTNPDHIKN